MCRCWPSLAKKLRFYYPPDLEQAVIAVLNAQPWISKCGTGVGHFIIDGEAERILNAAVLAFLDKK